MYENVPVSTEGTGEEGLMEKERTRTDGEDPPGANYADSATRFKVFTPLLGEGFLEREEDQRVEVRNRVEGSRRS